MSKFKINDSIKYKIGKNTYYGTITKIDKDKLIVNNRFCREETVALSSATLLPKVFLDEDTFKKLVRYELTLEDVLSDNIVSSIVNTSDYRMTVEDYICVLKKILSQKIDADTFYYELFEFFKESTSYNMHAPADNRIYNRNTVIMRTHNALLDWINYEYCNDFEDEDDNFVPIKNLLQDAEAFLEDEHKPLTSRRIPVDVKLNLLAMYENSDKLNTATQEEVELYKKVAQELCNENYASGLLAVGYGCYGGNRAFACDWKKSEECMLKLIDIVDTLPDRAFYANTLGYIYYYGRTTNGTPDYEKAYKYFSFAAFNGIYEAEYKIADMFNNGYGVPKSPKTAFDIVYRLYKENHKLVMDGNFDNKFADVAFRMGNYSQNHNMPYYISNSDIVGYYQQALFAIKMRMLETDYYGDKKVAEAIKSSLDEFKAKHKFKSALRVSADSLMMFNDFLSSGNCLDVEIKPAFAGKYSLTISAHAKANSRYPKRLFICIPELDMCGLYDSLTATLISPKDKPFSYKHNKFTVDTIDYDAMYFDGVPMLETENCSFEIKKDTSGDKLYRFVSVEFTSNGQRYDYLCDDKHIKIGDTVTVTTKDGKKSVTVVNIFEKSESETALPIKMYKKI